MKKQRFQRKTEKLRKTFFLLGLVFALSATYVVLTIKSAHHIIIPPREVAAVDDGITIPTTFREFEQPQEIKKVELKKVNQVLAKSFSNLFIQVPNGSEVDDNWDGFGIDEIPEVDEIAVSDVIWMKLDRKPIYQGCEKLTTEKERVACFQEKLSNYIVDNFETNPMGWGGTQKIYINFVIDKDGNVTSVNAIRGDEKDRKQLEKLIKNLPQFLPAMYKGRYVGTSFALPVELRN